MWQSISKSHVQISQQVEWLSLSLKHLISFKLIIYKYKVLHEQILVILCFIFIICHAFANYEGCFKSFRTDANVLVKNVQMSWNLDQT